MIMPLKRYRKKRNFKKTPEPAGGSNGHLGDKLHFVVQKHDASHLHYDFRLEHEGVLKSWAVPKGISTDPKIRRLAIQVEDHPFDYHSFEGIIPKGNYGAGTVMVWDNGDYYVDKNLSKEENEKLIKEALQKGHLIFYLNGKKLKGKYVIVKLKGKKNQWILIKKPDGFANQPIANADESVQSGQTLDEISMKPKATWTSPKILSVSRNILKNVNLRGATKSPMPLSVKPMLATLTDEVLDNPDWIYEVKWDGYRILAQIKDGDVRLYSRHDKTYNALFSKVVHELKKFPFNMILDGEMVVVDEKGISQFQLLQNYMRRQEGQLLYYVFDILYLDRYDLHDLPLSQRREILETVVADSGVLRLSKSIENHGRAFFEAAKQNGLEGIIAKNLQSFYQFGQRTYQWLKIKAVQKQEAVICGFTKPRGSRQYFGALILGVYKDGELIYVGHTGGGFNEDSLKDLYERLQPLVKSQCPFRKKPKTNAPVFWVDPKLVCAIKFQEWTEDGHMRQPVFLRLREDKIPTEVRKEKPLPAKKLFTQKDSSEKATKIKTKSPSGILLPASNIPIAAKVSLTHLDKVYWPQEGYTKGDLIKYYQDIASFILPYIKGRSQVLHRHPEGIQDKGFFQKDINFTPPPLVKTVVVESESQGEKVRYLICQNKETLAYINNLGCIEINVWASTFDKLDHPNYLVLDFDPVEIEFSRVIEVILKARDVLEKTAVKGFCKTSGGRGMHIYIPLQKKYTFDQAKDFAQILCNVIHNQTPSLTSLERSPQKRKGLIYLDYLQNHYGATMAAPYSVRPRPGAPVSTPLQWSEVTPKLNPQKFTMKTILPRLEKKGDLWKGLLGFGISMEKSLKIIEKIYYR